MQNLSVKIVPSADKDVRGDMYAALLIKIDSVDNSIISSKKLLEKYSATYDDIIKHPNAKMAPVTCSPGFTLGAIGAMAQGGKFCRGGKILDKKFFLLNA